MWIYSLFNSHMTYCLASWLHTLFTPLRVFCSIADLDRPPHFFSFRSSLPGWSAASYSSGNFCRKKLAGLEKQLLHYSQVDPRRWQLIRKAHWACRLGQACLLWVSQISNWKHITGISLFNTRPSLLFSERRLLFSCSMTIHTILMWAGHCWARWAS